MQLHHEVLEDRRARQNRALLHQRCLLTLPPSCILNELRMVLIIGQHLAAGGKVLSGILIEPFSSMYVHFIL